MLLSVLFGYYLIKSKNCEIRVVWTHCGRRQSAKYQAPNEISTVPMLTGPRCYKINTNISSNNSTSCIRCWGYGIVVFTDMGIVESLVVDLCRLEPMCHGSPFRDGEYGVKINDSKNKVCYSKNNLETSNIINQIFQ